MSYRVAFQSNLKAVIQGDWGLILSCVQISCSWSLISLRSRDMYRTQTEQISFVAFARLENFAISTLMVEMIRMLFYPEPNSSNLKTFQAILYYLVCCSRQSCIVILREKRFEIFQGKNVRQPGIEPGSIAWKATMLTFTPPTLER